ncbi:IS30 family transposase [Enterococcus casseliflavus]|uniref:IS30 family transposase n=1 Tax=Enterococcus casseliflavus TaxID=37734 RepID=UPI0039A52838
MGKNEKKNCEAALSRISNLHSLFYTPDCYDEIYAQNQYDAQRATCHRPSKYPQVKGFLTLFTQLFKEFSYSPDAVVGRVKRERRFLPEEMVCTTTLYAYINAQLLEIRNIDLLDKLKRKTVTRRIRKNKKVLGESIEKRPPEVLSRESFGHFEIDTVIGKRDGSETALLTLTERKTRFELIRLLDRKDADSVSYALKQLIAEFGPTKFDQLFQSITSDSGSEFALLTETMKKFCPVYFTHPYTSCERGTNENHNRMIRRTLPKSQSLDMCSRKDIQRIEDQMNHLPRKVLNYATPQESFDQEVLLAVS